MLLLEEGICACLVAQSCPTLCDPMDCTPPGSSIHGDSPGKNTGVDCHALLQGIFPTKGLKPDLPYCRWILYHLSHQGSPRILEWVAYPFSRGRRHRCISSVQFSSVQSLSRVQLFVIPWTTAHQASLSITDSRSPPKPMSIESVMPSNHLIHCCPLILLPQSFPASGSLPMSQLFAWGGQSIRVSASTSVLPMNTKDWSPLGWTGWISLQSKELSRVFSNTTVQKHQFFGAQLSLESNSHIHTWPMEKP